jgi:hypothetical protein
MKNKFRVLLIYLINKNDLRNTYEKECLAIFCVDNMAMFDDISNQMSMIAKLIDNMFPSK